MPRLRDGQRNRKSTRRRRNGSSGAINPLMNCFLELSMHEFCQSDSKDSNPVLQRQNPTMSSTLQLETKKNKFWQSTSDAAFATTLILIMLVLQGPTFESMVATPSPAVWCDTTSVGDSKHNQIGPWIRSR
ncbi:conserved hypothetical protein [Coccidioides posadasii str. Silveira]|uniref:Uncharacterized protein n=1 Tax=Coccidioides posadasii (strain RMSCC 757 / Silveira) TaxID=443226 RepID=E9DK09_COCPS|nr:conserved hypothetical protein [Coccidioides posadasii str. Silveira]